MTPAEAARLIGARVRAQGVWTRETEQWAMELLECLAARPVTCREAILAVARCYIRDGCLTVTPPQDRAVLQRS